MKWNNQRVPLKKYFLLCIQISIIIYRNMSCLVAAPDFKDYLLKEKIMLIMSLIIYPDFTNIIISTKS